MDLVWEVVVEEAVEQLFDDFDKLLLHMMLAWVVVVVQVVEEEEEAVVVRLLAFAYFEELDAVVKVAALKVILVPAMTNLNINNN